MLKLLLKLAVTAGLFWWLLSQVDSASLRTLLAQAQAGYLLLAVAIYSTGVVVSGWRWQAVARALRLRLSLAFFVRKYYEGMWFSQALPSGIGGDVVKAYALTKASGKAKPAVMSVLLERASGLGVLVGLLALSMPLLWQFFPGHPVFWLLLLLTGCGLAAVPVLMFAVRWEGLYTRKATRFFWRLSRDVNRVFFASWGRLLVQAGSSLYVQLASIGAFWCVAQALGQQVDFMVCVALCPPLFLLLVLPVSLAGWGLREGAAVGLFTLAGVMDAPAALAVSLVYGVVTLATAVPGGVFWITDRSRLVAAKDVR
ncbi:MAG: hypothetical protein GC134_04375 [Proteobacteria bacterium]|nr:hypothetical protein [Pseudomonadota bacterium]